MFTSEELKLVRQLVGWVLANSPPGGVEAARRLVELDDKCDRALRGELVDAGGAAGEELPAAGVEDDSADGV